MNARWSNAIVPATQFSFLSPRLDFAKLNSSLVRNNRLDTAGTMSDTHSEILYGNEWIITPGMNGQNQ